MSWWAGTQYRIGWPFVLGFLHTSCEAWTFFDFVRNVYRDFYCFAFVQTSCGKLFWLPFCVSKPGLLEFVPMARTVGLVPSSWTLSTILVLECFVENTGNWAMRWLGSQKMLFLSVVHRQMRFSFPKRGRSFRWRKCDSTLFSSTGK